VHHFTPDQAEFIREHVAGRGNLELTDMFNARFCSALSINQIKAYKKNHNLSSGLNGRFNLGRVPHNKGKKGVGGWEPTQFKKGNKPWNYLPVGTERVNSDGYVDVKITDPKTWKQKHLIIWEEANGPIPKGHVLIFGDGNPKNVTLENLILVSRKQLVRLNQKNLIQNDIELTRSGIIIADIFNKIGERKKQRKRREVSHEQ